MTRRLSMREFYAPLPLAAVALMALNDAVWKWQFHNAVTGKLSDIAGCFLLPLFVSAVLELATRLPARVRIWTGGAVAALFFISMKVHQPTADAICAGMTLVGRYVGSSCGGIVADPADLIAVPFIGLAVVYGLSRTRPEVATT